MVNECGTVDGMKIGRGNRSTRRTPTSVSLFPQFPHDLTWDRTVVLFNHENSQQIVKSRRMRWAGYVTRIGNKRNAYRIFVRKPEGKRPPGKPRP
jgi:hypothetical protein